MVAVALSAFDVEFGAESASRDCCRIVLTTKTRKGYDARRTPFRSMAKGTVDFFNDTGGYGFIKTEDADDDVFFHMEDVGGPDLEEGQEVEFDIEQAPKGPRATNVTRL